MDYYYANDSDKIREDAPQKRDAKTALFDWVDIFVTSVLVVIVIFTFLFRVVTITGDSMRNTLEENDKVIISDIAYTPKQGDIVVISRNMDNSLTDTSVKPPIIKRVIAVAGQTVDIDYEEGIVYVDGVALKEDYTRTLTTERHEYDIEFPAYVPENCIFVMGDNRNESLDSRSSLIGDNGMIDTRYVLGKAVFRLFPFNKIGGLY